jgi:hypothetical protein
MFIVHELNSQQIWYSETAVDGELCNLCNGGALYAPYSFLRFSNMLCEGRVPAQWGGGEWGNRVAKLLYDPVFRVIK